MPLFVASLGLGAGLLGWALWRVEALPLPVALHAAAMITAWGVLMPAGGIIARYFKVTARQRFPDEVDNPFWWTWHRALQYAGLVLSTAGLALILRLTGGRLATAHGLCGAGVMTLAWLQVVSSLLRGSKGGASDTRADPGDPATWRGDHYDMTPRRLVFEAWHKTSGWAAIGLAAATILLGTALIGAPPWLLLVVGALQGATVCALIDGVLRHRWIDTYVALWGPDTRHPGNRRTALRRPG